MANFFWYFILYSLFGFGLEVVFTRLTRDEKQNRKCLYALPLCPVYGVGAVAIVLATQSVRDHFWLLLLSSIAVATAVEYLIGLFYEKILKVSFWNYSHLPLNLGGKVCLMFSVAWGILGLILTYFGHPLVAELVEGIPAWLTLPAVVLFVGDAAFSARLLRRYRNTDVLRWRRRRRWES